ncbi:MAG TPA: ATP-binding protein [Pyrinomonadaceae bacterium]|nr:ATP-binding protein [Pyrinomonadaceae bacterium]
MIRVLRYSSLLNYSVGLLIACAVLLLWPGLAANLFAVGNGADFFMTHEHCYLGITPLVLMHFISDLLIGLSYVAISLMLTYLVYRARRDIPFHWVFLAFGLFIVACGSTHFMEVWTTFNAPVYWFAGYLKLITAVASVATALVLPPLIPRTLALVKAAKVSEVRREELEQANRELETLYGRVKELDEQKTHFFANVSHELRTPLTLILSPARQLLNSPTLGDEERRNLETIERNARSLLKHVNDLLDISKLEAGKMRVSYTETDLAQLLRLAAAYFESFAIERGIEFSVDAPERLPAEADAEKMQRVLVNLLSNAFKFTPDGGRIRCTLADKGGRARLEVSDSGLGVAPELREVIFERFRQAESGATRRFGGTGLGLSIAKEFVELHGGRVEVGDAPEGGASFELELPLSAPRDAEVQRDAEAQNAESLLRETAQLALGAIETEQAQLVGETRRRDDQDASGTEATRGAEARPGGGDERRDEATTVKAAGRDNTARSASPLSPPTVAELALAPLVLVVEDNHEMNRFITEQLRAKYRVASAWNGREGIERALALRPDLILTDVMMPEMSGDQFVSELRTHTELASVPVCMLTAKADEDLRVRLLRSGVQDYLMKPFVSEELLARVANLIETKRTRDALQFELDSQHHDLTKLADEVSLRRREMQAALAELRESNQTLEAIIHASPLGIVTLDPEGVVKMWNQSAERIYGWSEREVLGQVLPTVPPDRMEEVRRNHRQAVAGTAFKAYETVRLRKDGTQINVSISTAPLRDAEGRTNGVVALVEDISERVRAESEKALLASEVEAQRHRLDAIITSVPGVVWESWGEPDEATQRINFVSDYVKTMLGYTVEDWLSTPNFWLSIVHPEDRDAAARTATETFTSGKVGINQFRWMRKDGRAVWVESHSVAIMDESNRPVGMRGVTMDITERKEAGEALRRSEERYRAFVEQSSEPIWRIEFDPPVSVHLSVDEQIERCYAGGYMAECNDVMARMYGYESAAELIGKRLEDFLPPTEDNLEYLRAAVRSGYRLLDRESQELDRDGRVKYFLNNLVGIIEGDALRRAWGTQRDITERRQAAETERFLGDTTTMLASSLDYELTLESVARLAVPYVADFCLVHMLEDDGSIRRMIVAHQNPEREAAWREMQTRFPLDLNTPHTIAKVLRTGQPEMFSEVTDELLTAVIRDPREIAMLKEFDIKASMIMPLTARGRTIGALTFISSESARHYGAHDFALARELARRAALAIDNARLYRRAQEANRAKDEFLATLSHELRTPLTPIIGWVHMMSGGQLAAADISHGLAVIAKNSQSLSHLINDLLDMSAILSGKMRIDTLPVSLDTVVKEAIETVRPHASKQNIRLELSVAPGADNATVSGDRTRLVQVFWNLLTNAVKFSPDDSRVRVACEVVDSSARVHIEDEGEGITAEFLPYVFDRFRQQDMSTTKTHGGLGIGLALVKSFVEAHGGTVRAESAGAGRGSRFTVTLPLLVQPQPTGASTEATADKAACEVTEACHVLLVEDAPDTLEMLRVTFEVRGFRTRACATPEEALDIAANEHFDIIVSDIGLPNINGYELLKLLRTRTPHLREVPALALTGYAAQKDVDAALSAGFDAHLAKPFDPATLAATVDALLKRQQPEPPEADA